jgi:hypothetical protein
MNGLSESDPRGETIELINHTTQTLAELVKDLPIGTNSALYQFLWMLLSGRLHDSRGALFPALQSMGLEEAEVRRSLGRLSIWPVDDSVSAFRLVCPS